MTSYRKFFFSLFIALIKRSFDSERVGEADIEREREKINILSSSDDNNNNVFIYDSSDSIKISNNLS